MKAHSEQFKTNIAQIGKQITSKITYQDNGTTIELGDEELNSVSLHYKGNILKSVMKQLDIDSNQDIPVGTELNYQFGLKVHEPYDEPFEIIGSTSQVTTEGKNLIPNNKASGTSKGVTFTVQEDGTYLVNGKNDGTGNSYIYIAPSQNITLLAGTYYGIATQTGVNVQSKLTYTDDTNQYVDLSRTSFTISKQVKKIEVYLQVSNGTTTTFEDYKLYPIISTTPITAETYEPYTNGPTPNPDYPQPIINKTGHITEIINNEQYEFDLGNIELCKIGSYEDIIFQNRTDSELYNNELDLNAWYIKKNIGKVDLSTLSWTANSMSDVNYRRYTTTSIQDIKYVNANTDLGNGLAEKYKNHTGRGMSSQDAINCFAIDVSQIQAVDLAGHNPSGLFYYALANPTYTKITNATLLSQLNAVGTQLYEYLNYGNFIVKESEKQEDYNSYKITCYDKMLYSMVDYEDLGITYPITIRNYINSICAKLGLIFKNANETFANYNRQIVSELYLDSGGNKLGYTYRDVLDELAEVTASTICINNNDQLEIRYLTETNDTIDEDYFKDTKVDFGEKYGPVNSIVLSRSAETDNVVIKDDTSIAQNGLCEIKIIDNQIMNWNDRADYLPDIFTKLGGLQYYINDFSSYGIMYYELGDKYTSHIGDNNYNCVMLNDEINIEQGLEELIYTEMPIPSETEYKYADSTDRKINETYLIVDKQNQAIEGVVSRVDGQDEQIATIRLQYNELLSRISDIADITTSGESSYASVNLTNVNESQPIDIKIHPIIENISYLYPRGILPSEYQQVEYIESTSYTHDKNYIDLGFKPNNNTTIELKAKYSTTSTQYSRLYGSSNLFRTETTGNNSTDTWFYYGSNSRQKVEGLDTNFHIFKEDKNKIYLDGTLELTFNEDTFQDTNNLRLFSATTGDRDGLVQMAYAKLWDNGTLIRDLIPCYRISDNEIGMYDLVNDVFYTNQGTGSFTKGNDVSNNLYPSNILYPKTRTLRFTNTDTDEVFDWIIPTDLWWCDNTTYDELELSYGDGTNSSVIVTRKCEINADGSVSVLATPTTETYSYPSWLVLTDGDYTISLIDNNTGYLYVQLMAKNIYTTQFYTKAETNSLVEQTANSITTGVNQTLSNYSTTTETNTTITQAISNNNSAYVDIEVAKKVNNTDFTKANIVAKINDNTSQVKIDADNVDISGKTINLTSDEIAITSTNFSVDKNGKMTCNNADINGKITSNNGKIGGWDLNNNGLSNDTGFYINNVGVSNVYTMSDILICQAILLEIIPMPNTNTPEFRHYDINNDGVINSNDLLAIRNLLNR